MSAQIKRFIVPDAYRTHPVKIIEDGFTATVVLHTDHLAAIAAASAYDEEKERGLFEAEYKVGASYVRYDTNTRQYVTDWPSRETLDLAWRANILLEGWLACAKARAKAAGNL